MFKNLSPILWDEDPASGEAPANDPDEAAAEPAAGSAAGGSEGSAEAPETPWHQDLTETFTDEAQRAQVDKFLRDNVQPYVTKLEQDSSSNRNANKLWDDFTNSPVETYVAVTQELFGDDVAGSITRVLKGDGSASEEDEEVAGEALDTFTDLDDEDDLDQYPQEVQEAVEFAQESKRREAYEAEMARVREENSDMEFEDELFAPFIAAADGDFDLAAEGYKDFIAKSKEKFGFQIDTENLPKPPNVINSETSTNTVPPTAEKYDSIDEALDSFFEEQKSAPPVVGSA